MLRFGIECHLLRWVPFTVWLSDMEGDRPVTPYGKGQDPGEGGAGP
jgi:hypothetical protein